MAQSSRNYPKIDTDRISGLTDRERWIVNRILNNGTLRASKPQTAKKVEFVNEDTTSIFKTRYDYASDSDAMTGEAAYVWRMVAFYVSPDSKHHCLPMTAEFDLPGRCSEYTKLAKELDKLVDRIVDTIDKSQWHGVQRWGLAMGQIGTPYAKPAGEICYQLNGLTVENTQNDDFYLQLQYSVF